MKEVQNHNQKHYLEKISYELPLSKLYTVENTSYNNQNQEFCLVLVKI